jgi:hypothetical protein
MVASKSSRAIATHGALRGTWLAHQASGAPELFLFATPKTALGASPFGKLITQNSRFVRREVLHFQGSTPDIPSTWGTCLSSPLCFVLYIISSIQSGPLAPV